MQLTKQQKTDLEYFKAILEHSSLSESDSQRIIINEHAVSLIISILLSQAEDEQEKLERISDEFDRIKYDRLSAKILPNFVVQRNMANASKEVKSDTDKQDSVKQAQLELLERLLKRLGNSPHQYICADGTDIGLSWLDVSDILEEEKAKIMEK